MPDADSPDEAAFPSADDLVALAAASGVTLDRERAASLVAAATPHFAMLRRLDRFGPTQGEPAAFFALVDEAGNADA